jgi:cytochrome b
VSRLSHGATSRPHDATVRVWDVPQRVCHWVLALSVLTAWLSANIYDTLHEATGYLAMGVVAFRLVWGLVGGTYARFRNFVRPPAVVLRYLRDLAHGRAARHLGHNPAGAAMAVTLLIMIATSTITGWMQLTYTFFGVTWVEVLHTWSSHLVLALALVHVAGVLTMCALQKENLVRAMVTGRKAAGERGEDAQPSQ